MAKATGPKTKSFHSVHPGVAIAQECVWVKERTGRLVEEFGSVSDIDAGVEKWLRSRLRQRCEQLTWTRGRGPGTS